MLVQLVLSVDTWTWNAARVGGLPVERHAADALRGAQVDLEPLRVGERARPSRGGAAVNRGACRGPAFSVEEAVAVLFSAMLVVPQVAADALGAVAPKPATRTDTTSAAKASRLTAARPKRVARLLSLLRSRLPVRSLFPPNVRHKLWL